MIAVTAHPDKDTRRVLADVLEAAGWTVLQADNTDEAVCAARQRDADVVLAAESLAGGAMGLLDRIKRDADLFRIAVVLVGSGLGVAEVLAAMGRGADDVLRTPLDPADVVARVTAAARTKALVQELTAQNNRLEELIFFDELTGLRNRRAILHELEMLLAGARRHGHKLSVLMVDIDNFKEINDQHGHRSGDDVLREVGRRLRERLRREDVAGRLGGDELLVLLSDTDARGAGVVADSIRHALAEGAVETSGGLIDVTVSIGSAEWQGEELPTLLERADRGLYAAKGGGRDRTVSS